MGGWLSYRRCWCNRQLAFGLDVSAWVFYGLRGTSRACIAEQCISNFVSIIPSIHDRTQSTGLWPVAVSLSLPSFDDTLQQGAAIPRDQDFIAQGSRCIA